VNRYGKDSSIQSSISRRHSSSSITITTAAAAAAFKFHPKHKKMTKFQIKRNTL
jgi:hypothetical protein